MSVTQSNIPDLVNLVPMKDDTLVEVETDILEPVVHSQTFCRFALDRKGILSSNSKITFGLSAAAIRSFYSLNNGVNSLVARAVLKANNKTIAEVDAWNHFAAYNSMFIHNEQNVERESVLTARTMNHEFDYLEDPFDVNSSGTGAARLAQNQADTYTWKNHYEENEHVTDKFSVAQWAVGENAPVFQIALSDFFPFLKTNQLPLFMIKDQLFVELHFAPEANTKGDRQCVNASETNASMPLDVTKTRLIADYIYYPQDMMNQYAMVNANLSFSYVDYRLSEMSVNSSGAKNLIRNVGGAGRIVSKIVQGIQNLEVGAKNGGVAAPAQCLTGPYHAFAPQRAADGSTTAYLDANVRVNNDFLFPLDIKNSARLFHTITSTEGKIPFVSRDEYNRQGGALTTKTLEGIAESGNTLNTQQLNGLQGHFFWQAFKVTPGRVDGRGIEVYMKYLEDDGTFGLDAGGDDAYTHRVWVELVKYARLNDGHMECGYV